MTTPYGNVEPPFDLCKLAITAGATFVSRWNTHRVSQGVRAIEGALQHKGFALVEFIAQCPTNFGRRALGTSDPTKCIQWIEERSVMLKEAENLSDEELKDRFVLGDFIKYQRPVFKGSSILAAGGKK
jgi:2-oxoglutarate ferredoxin oxidoreductase subunit beta